MDNHDDMASIAGAYYRGYKTLELKFSHPRQLKEWIYAIWGMDIFFGPVPFLKTIVLANLLVWVWLFSIVRFV